MNRKLAFLLSALPFTLLMNVNQCLSQTVSIFGNAIQQSRRGRLRGRNARRQILEFRWGSISAIQFYRER